MFDKGLVKGIFSPPSRMDQDESQQHLNEDMEKLQQTLRNKSLVIEAYNGHTSDNKSSFINVNKPIQRVAQLKLQNFPKTYFLLSFLASFLFFPVGFYAMYQSKKVSVYFYVYK